MITTALIMSVIMTNPYDIFAMARARWESQHYPGKLVYTVAVDVVEAGSHKRQQYEAGYDAEQGTLLVDPVSDVERAHPYHPPGGFGFQQNLSAPGRPNPDVDFFGVPVLAPNYSFGIGVTPRGGAAPDSMELVREVRAQFHDPMPASRKAPTPQTSPPLQEIAAVSSRTSSYEISFAGVESVDGTPTYHLVLRALRDAGRYRLRDVWIDTKTYAPRKLVEGLNFVTGPGTSVPWVITFEQIDGASYVASETSLGSTTLGRHHYGSVTITFENVRAVDQLPRGISSSVPTTTLVLLEP